MLTSAVFSFTTIPNIDDCRLLVESLTPGAHIAGICYAPYHRIVCNLEDAGFEIRDQIAWIRDEDTIPVVLARKPLSESTIAENVLKHGTGAINVDACRIGSDTITSKAHSYGGGCFTKLGGTGFYGNAESTHVGRFPANLILSKSAADRLDLQSGALRFFQHCENESELIAYLDLLIKPPTNSAQLTQAPSQRPGPC